MQRSHGHKIIEVNKYSHACAMHYGLFICEGSEAYTSQAALFHPGSIGPREGRYHMTSQHRGMPVNKMTYHVLDRRVLVLRPARQYARLQITFEILIFGNVMQ